MSQHEVHCDAYGIGGSPRNKPCTCLVAVVQSLSKALEEAASLRESDLDEVDDYVKHWRSLLLIANRA
jgi:hypothetical protein